MLKSTFKFALPNDNAVWKVVVHELLKDSHRQRFVITRDKEVIMDATHPAGIAVISGVREIDFPGFDFTLAFGAVSKLKYAIAINRGGAELWRSDKRPFRVADRYDEKLSNIEEWATSDDRKDQFERQKKLYPSIIVDIGFGVLFFFVAREFGLVTAALTGAAATLVLFAAQPFVKWDLLGGFAVFGVVMSLISAGIAWGFQDDLAVKLRGTWMALIGAVFAFYDAFVLNGGYLGKRMSMYMEGIGRLNHKRASLALGAATLILMAIDTPLAFILTTDQWIWYNSVFDMFIAIPIVLGCMFWAREKKETKTDLQ